MRNQVTFCVFHSVRIFHAIISYGSSNLFKMQPEVPFLPVFASMKRLIRYSLGSIALGSLIVSFVESIHYMLESIRRKLKVASSTPDGWIGKTAYHTSQFCLRCIEWTIKSVNRNAYIMVSHLIKWSKTTHLPWHLLVPH